MRVLVTAASKHGSTKEIAEAIAATLRERQLDAEVREPTEVATLEGYDAVVVGSAVYMGRWLEPARQFVDANHDALASLPVWLFSSGPIGDPAKQEEEPVDVTDIVASTGASDHVLFAGKLDRGDLGFAEKTVAMALHAPQGDFRDWPAIDQWAGEIANALA